MQSRRKADVRNGELLRSTERLHSGRYAGTLAEGATDRKLPILREFAICDRPAANYTGLNAEETGRLRR
jgi:hypothetical protein